MGYDFDQVIDRRGTGCAKWDYYPADVLPMWVADMDFKSPQPVIDALRERAAQGFFGYEMPSAALGDVICERMERLYGWKVTRDQIVYIPSLVSGINIVCRAVGEPGDGVLMHTPVYPPFLTAPAAQGRVAQTAPLALASDGQRISYSIDYDAMEGAITERTRLFLLCHPHNPIGVSYGRADLERMAELCERHDLVICSDEIHCDLLLGGTRHMPMAALAPEVADRCITLMAPSKTFNLPGLKASFAIIQNAELRQRVTKAYEGLITGVNSLGLCAMLAAYRDCGEWLEALLPYLTANRDALMQFVASELPQIRMTAPEATYLAWLDCREAGIEGSPYTYFLERSKVALSDGAIFGAGGEGFVRLNFACPRSMLMEGLERLKQALHQPAAQA